MMNNIWWQKRWVFFKIKNDLIKENLKLEHIFRRNQDDSLDQSIIWNDSFQSKKLMKTGWCEQSHLHSNYDLIINDDKISLNNHF